jgi:HD-GYP domain-containing protein (c-di-GMP phosphodiesterase class II)
VDSYWSAPGVLFAIVVTCSVVGLIGAATMLVLGSRSKSAALTRVGGCVYAVSAMALVHGVSTPGVWYPTDASTMTTMSSMYWALPLATVAAVPLIWRRQSASLADAGRHQRFARLHVVTTSVVALVVVLAPDWLTAPEMAGPVAVGTAALALTTCFVLSARQLRLSRIGRTWQPFTSSLAIALVGGSSLVWLAPGVYTPLFWAAHLAGAAALLLYLAAVIRSRRATDSMTAALQPFVAQRDITAFAQGLDLQVHQILASLGSMDTFTRDHVVRVSALALDVGRRLRVSATDLHTLGLGALLHDTGKLAVPITIINKPGRLDPEERATVSTHAGIGDDMIRRLGGLVAIAPIVRSHHERIDGGGYPDGLVGDEIPWLARIVSVCDAFDALASDRQYREGMGIDRAVAILREHAGSQWDAVVVEALVTSVRHGVPPHDELDRVGRNAEPLGGEFDPFGHAPAGSAPRD